MLIVKNRLSSAEDVHTIDECLARDLDQGIWWRQVLSILCGPYWDRLVSVYVSMIGAVPCSCGGHYFLLVVYLSADSVVMLPIHPIYGELGLVLVEISVPAWTTFISVIHLPEQVDRYKLIITYLLQLPRSLSCHWRHDSTKMITQQKSILGRERKATAVVRPNAVGSPDVLIAPTIERPMRSLAFLPFLKESIYTALMEMICVHTLMLLVLSPKSRKLNPISVVPMPQPFFVCRAGSAINFDSHHAWFVVYIAACLADDASLVRPDDAPTSTADAAGRAEDPVLLTSLSAQLDRCYSEYSDGWRGLSLPRKGTDVDLDWIIPYGSTALGMSKPACPSEACEESGRSEEGVLREAYEKVNGVPLINGTITLDRSVKAYGATKQQLIEEYESELFCCYNLHVVDSILLVWLALKPAGETALYPLDSALDPAGSHRTIGVLPFAESAAGGLNSLMPGRYLLLARLYATATGLQFPYLSVSSVGTDHDVVRGYGSGKDLLKKVRLMRMPDTKKSGMVNNFTKKFMVYRLTILLVGYEEVASPEQNGYRLSNLTFVAGKSESLPVR
ncbi:hypothetical protein Tco_0810678 [Tanacetum coccineum]